MQVVGQAAVELDAIRERGFFDLSELWSRSNWFYEVFEAWYEDSQRPWMIAAIDTLMTTPVPGTGVNVTNRAWNMTWGQRIYPGREGKYEMLADILLVGTMDSVLVVPSETAPYTDRQKHVRRIKGICHNDERLNDAIARIWVSRPLDIIPVDESQWVRKDVVERAYPPFYDANTCIVCDASRMSLDELELIRAAEWKRYIELG